MRLGLALAAVLVASPAVAVVLTTNKVGCASMRDWNELGMPRGAVTSTVQAKVRSGSCMQLHQGDVVEQAQQIIKPDDEGVPLRFSCLTRKNTLPNQCVWVFDGAAE